MPLPAPRDRVKRRQEVAHARPGRKRDRIVNAILGGLRWTALKLLEEGLPVIGKAIAGGVVALAVRWWFGE